MFRNRTLVLLVILLFVILSIVGLVFYLRLIKVPPPSFEPESGRIDSDKVKLESQFSGYDLKKTLFFPGFLTYLEHLDFLGKEAIYDSEARKKTTAESLTIILTDTPRLGDRLSYKEDETIYTLSSFDTRIQDGEVFIYLHIDPEVAKKAGLDLDDVFNTALMRATYFLTTEDATAFEEHLKEAQDLIRQFYQEPYVNVVKKLGLRTKIIKFFLPEVFAQACPGCERWECGAPTYEMRCEKNPIKSCVKDSDCDDPVYGYFGPCVSTLVLCVSAYCEDSPFCGSPGGACPVGQCVVPGSYSCTCPPTPTPSLGPTATPTSPPPPTATPTPTPTPVPSCNVTSLLPNPANTDVGDTTTFTANVAIIAGSVDQVNFSSSDVTVATVAASDTTSPYNTIASSLAPGTTTITANVVMGGVIRCSKTATLNVETPSCSITAYDLNLEGVGDKDVTVQITPGTIDPPIYSILNILFTINPPLVAQITANPLFPNPDLGAPYQVEMEALSIGSSTYRATATLNDPWSTQCYNDRIINVSNPSGWWQVREGDIIAASGNILTSIPASCNLAYGCNPVMITHDPADPGSSPGVPSAFGSITYGSGDVSSPSPPYGWKAPQSSYSGKTYNYDFFEKKAESVVTPQSLGSATIAGSALESGGTSYEGYYWYKYEGSAYGGNLTIQSDVSLGTRKVILLVNDANLTIQGKINLTKGRGFFMAIVDQSISIDPLIGGGVGPHIEGIYIADDAFSTGVGGSTQFRVRGSVAAGSVSLDRNLLDNSQAPAELFEFAPDQFFAFPSDLSTRRLVWREVAP